MSGYQRVLMHYGSDPTDFRGVISSKAISGCWFELHRRGGCGAGEVRLKDSFVDRTSITVGDWIAFEPTLGDRWYLGRVEQKESSSPAGVSLRLQGMGVELGEVFPGGFGADGGVPHLYRNTDVFPNDPDRGLETYDSASRADEVVRQLLQQYIVPRTNITYSPSLVESPSTGGAIQSLKFRGEESVRSVIKELAIRARDSSWGVDEEGQFFFLQKREDILATFREGRDLTFLEETQEREHLFNRVVLTGGYVYDREESSGQVARRSYRWRGNYTQPESRDQFGERRIRIWVPWIRTPEDSQSFVREFFRVYSQPTTRYLMETIPQAVLPRLWQGQIRLEAHDGSALITEHIETIRVEFDHAIHLRLELGPEDPRRLWHEPPQDERWELPEGQPAGFGGGDVSLTGQGSGNVTSSDISSSDVTSSDITSSNVTSSDITSSNITSSDITSSDITSSDITSSDLTSSDISSSAITSSSGVSSSDGNSSGGSSLSSGDNSGGDSSASGTGSSGDAESSLVAPSSGAGSGSGSSSDFSGGSSSGSSSSSSSGILESSSGGGSDVSSGLSGPSSL